MKVSMTSWRKTGRKQGEMSDEGHRPSKKNLGLSEVPVIHLFAWDFHPEILPAGIKWIINTDLFTETGIIR